MQRKSKIEPLAVMQRKSKIMNMKKLLITLLIWGLIVCSCKNSNKDNRKVNAIKNTETTLLIEKTNKNIDSTESIKTGQYKTVNSNQDSTIEWRKLKIRTIEKIDKSNDSIIDTEEKPNIDDSKIVFRVTSTPALFFELPKDFKEYSEKVVDEYITNNQITDNHYKAKRYAIVKNDERYLMKEYLTEVGYYYEEGGGVRRRISIIGGDTVKSNDIFLMFDEDLHFTEREIDLVKIEHKDEYWILPENEILYKEGKERLTFEYSGILSTKSFQYGGMGTIEPTYVNVRFVIKNQDTGSEHEIFKLPYTFNTGLRDIILCDINGDRRKDIILEIEDELSRHRLLYLTKIEDSKARYNFTGIMEFYREDP